MADDERRPCEACERAIPVLVAQCPFCGHRRGTPVVRDANGMLRVPVVFAAPPPSRLERILRGDDVVGMQRHAWIVGLPVILSGWALFALTILLPGTRIKRWGIVGPGFYLVSGLGLFMGTLFRAGMRDASWYLWLLPPLVLISTVAAVWWVRGRLGNV